MKTNIKLLLTILAASACLQGVAQAKGHFTAYRYNLAGQLTGTISADPDGDGPLWHTAVRNTYNANGLLEKAETGWLTAFQAASVDPADWGPSYAKDGQFRVEQVTRIFYDEFGRKVRELQQEGSGYTLAVTEYSYDIHNRLHCEAVRMDPSTFDIPRNACTQSGGSPKDRITRYSYDELGRTRKIAKAVATTLRQDYVTYTYAANHHDGPEYVTDAKGNKARMVYDDLHRLTHWYFPSKGATGQVSTDDYEQYWYDNNGNRTKLRKRDVRLIDYDYDALDRLVFKDLPAGERDVYYDYDLRGLQTEARFDSPTGPGLSHGYDGFGRLLSATTTMLGPSRTLGYQYDDNDNRTQITHPDGRVFNYAYDGLNRNTTISEHDNLLVTNGYDSLGRRIGITHSSGANTAAYFDSLSRLTQLGHTWPGRSAHTLFQYNPASQIVARSLTDAQFIHNGDDNLVGTYTVNGLNQYTDAGGIGIAYDDNGNLTSDGSDTYSYDAENRLTGVSGTHNATLKYDPLGRLYEYTAGGVTRRLLYDGDALVAEYNTGHQIVDRYVHGPGIDEPLVWYEGGGLGVQRSVHADHQGSIVAVSEPNSAALDTINTYDAYGIPDQGNLGRFAYTGQIHLAEIGLYHYKARAYSPRLGRFLQTDPVGYEDQINLYAYTHNDPLNLIDPTGKDSQALGVYFGARLSGKSHKEAKQMMVDAINLRQEMVDQALSVTRIGTAADVVEIAVDVSNGENPAPKVAGVTAGEAAEAVAEKVLSKKIGDKVASAVAAWIGKFFGDATEERAEAAIEVMEQMDDAECNHAFDATCL